MYNVVKRDGNICNFNISKITVAITKAFEAQNKQFTPDIIDLLALKVTADYESKIRDGSLGLRIFRTVLNPSSFRQAMPTLPGLHSLPQKPRENPEHEVDDS